MYKFVLTLALSGGLISHAFGVSVSSPASGSTVGSPVHFVATAGSTSCAKGVASMGIYKAPYQLAYTVSGTKLDTYLSLSAGSYTANVTQWDYCGGAATKAVSFTVSASATSKISTTGKTFYNVQASNGWSGHGELPPVYDMCSSCSGVAWSMTRGISSPSMDGKATKYSISGTRPYADVLWNNHVIGDGSTQGVSDSSHTLVNKLHNFTYDAYFYGSNLGVAENIEFDIGQFFSGMQFMFGTQCQVINGAVWGVWDSAHGHWVSTKIPCRPKNNAWNHVVIQFQRTSDNRLLYKSFTLNGVTSTLNWSYGHASAPGNWWGVAVNFQLDGNYNLADYSVYVDKMNISYY